MHRPRQGTNNQRDVLWLGLRASTPSFHPMSGAHPTESARLGAPSDHPATTRVAGHDDRLYYYNDLRPRADVRGL